MSRPVGMSYVSGVADQPLLYRTVDDVLTSAAMSAPDQLALIVSDQGVRWSFKDLDREVERVARGLVAFGLKAGDRIGIWAPNCVEWVLVMFAAARAGLILVNINPAYRTHELEFALNLVGCRALVFPRTFKSSNYLVLLQELIPDLLEVPPGQLASPRIPALRFPFLIGPGGPSGCLSFDELRAAGGDLESRQLTEISMNVDPDQPYNIQFTSGTTGAPKGATLSHFNLVNNGFFVGEWMRLTDADRICIPVPLYHCFGMVLGVLAAVTHRAACVFPSAGFDPLSVLEAVHRERCTALHGVPTMFIAEMDHPQFKDFDLSSLRTGIMAGASCPVALMRKVIETMHVPEITICYGMTETSPVSFQSDISDPLERRVSTVGRIHPHIQAKIVDATGRITPIGVAGELLTRGYCVMRGYWGDPDRTAEAIDQAGWMHTGDLATIDEHGYCSIVGRVKDMIIRGGEKISPREMRNSSTDIRRCSMLP